MAASAPNSGPAQQTDCKFNAVFQRDFCLSDPQSGMHWPSGQCPTPTQETWPSLASIEAQARMVKYQPCL